MFEAVIKFSYLLTYLFIFLLLLCINVANLPSIKMFKKNSCKNAAFFSIIYGIHIFFWVDLWKRKMMRNTNYVITLL